MQQLHHVFDRASYRPNF